MGALANMFAGRVMSGTPPTPKWTDLSLSEVSPDVSITESDIVNGDRLENHTVTRTERRFNLIQSVPRGLQRDVINLLSGTGAYLTGRQTRLSGNSAGSLVFTFVSGRQKTLSVPGADLQDVEIFNGFADDSLAAYCNANISNLIEGLTPSDTTKKIFTTFNPGGSSWALNPQCWAAALNWTWYSVGATGTGTGMLITPRHTVTANHVGAPSTVKFFHPTNGTVTRTVTGTQRIGASDILICLLDSEVPAWITPVKILPEEFTNNFCQDSEKAMSGVSLITCDQERKALIRPIFELEFNEPNGFRIVHSFSGEWAEILISGDSGHPAGLLINGDFVLLGTHDSPGTFPHLGSHHAAIVDALDDLAPGYSLSHPDLSEFPNYN